METATRVQIEEAAAMGSAELVVTAKAEKATQDKAKREAEEAGEKAQRASRVKALDEKAQQETDAADAIRRAAFDAKATTDREEASKKEEATRVTETEKTEDAARSRLIKRTLDAAAVEQTRRQTHRDLDADLVVANRVKPGPIGGHIGGERITSFSFSSLPIPSTSFPTSKDQVEAAAAQQGQKNADMEATAKALVEANKEPTMVDPLATIAAHKAAQVIKAGEKAVEVAARKADDTARDIKVQQQLAADETKQRRRNAQRISLAADAVPPQEAMRRKYKKVLENEVAKEAAQTAQEAAQESEATQPLPATPASPKQAILVAPAKKGVFDDGGVEPQPPSRIQMQAGRAELAEKVTAAKKQRDDAAQRAKNDVAERDAAAKARLAVTANEAKVESRREAARVQFQRDANEARAKEANAAAARKEKDPSVVAARVAAATMKDKETQAAKVRKTYMATLAADDLVRKTEKARAAREAEIKANAEQDKADEKLRTEQAVKQAAVFAGELEAMQNANKQLRKAARDAEKEKVDAAAMAIKTKTESDNAVKHASEEGARKIDEARNAALRAQETNKVQYEGGAGVTGASVGAATTVRISTSQPREQIAAAEKAKVQRATVKAAAETKIALAAQTHASERTEVAKKQAERDEARLTAAHTLVAAKEKATEAVRQREDAEEQKRHAIDAAAMLAASQLEQKKRDDHTRAEVAKKSAQERKQVRDDAVSRQHFKQVVEATTKQDVAEEKKAGTKSVTDLLKKATSASSAAASPAAAEYLKAANPASGAAPAATPKKDEVKTAITAVDCENDGKVLEGNACVPKKEAVKTTTPASIAAKPVTPVSIAAKPVTPASIAAKPVTPASIAAKPVTPASGAAKPVTPASITAEPVTPASGAAPATESTPTFDPSTDPTTQEMMNACATQCTDKNGDKCSKSAKHCFQEGGDEKAEILCAIKLGCQKCVSCMASQATNDHIEDALKVTKAKKAAEDEEQKKKAEAEEIAKEEELAAEEVLAAKAAGEEVLAAEGKSLKGL